MQVVWCADLPADEDLWVPTIAMFPPRNLESMPLPLSVFRAWIRGDKRLPGFGDLEGRSEVSAETGQDRKVLAWRGPEESLMLSTGALRPGETVVIPATWGGYDGFGWAPDSKEPVEDIAHTAWQRH